MDLEIVTSTAVGALIGSSLTLLGVWWGHRLDQKRLMTEAEHQVHSLLQSIHDEVETLWDNYMDTMGSHTDSLADGASIEAYWPITQDYFTIFHQNATRLGTIKNHDLRKLIVSTYASSKGLVDSYRLNNELLHKLEQAVWLSVRTKDSADVQRANAERAALTAYAAQVKKGHSKVKEKVQSLLRELRKCGVLNKT